LGLDLGFIFCVYFVSAKPVGALAAGIDLDGTLIGSVYFAARMAATKGLVERK